MSTFPNDAVSKYISINGLTTKATILSGATPRTILWFSTTHGWTSGTDILYCGNTVIFQWTLKTTDEIFGYFPPQFSAIPCSSVVYYTNGGIEIDQFNIVYTEYDLATAPIPDMNVNVNSQTLALVGTPPNTFYVDNVWTNGELFIVFLLTFILMGGILKFFWEFFYHKIVRIKTIQK